MAVTATVAAFLIGSSVQAEIDDVSAHRAPPHLAVYSNWHASAGLETIDGSVRTREHGLATGLLRMKRGRAVLDLGIEYEYTHFALTGIDSRNRDVHRLQIPLEFSIESGQRHWRGYVTPGIATSSNVFKDFLNRGANDDLTLAGRVELAGLGPSNWWFAGMAYDQNFGAPHFYPVFGLDTGPDRIVRVRLAFPDSAVWYRRSDRQAFSAHLFPAGDRWRVVTDDFRSDFDLRRKEWRLQLAWSVAVTSFVTIELSAGQAFDRRVVLTDRASRRIHAEPHREPFIGLEVRLAADSNTR